MLVSLKVKALQIIYQALIAIIVPLNGEDAEKQRQLLIHEATELMKIPGAILEKTK